ncbi:MAG: energy-coupled thiamine transporter ThiT, partial [Clostridia bacterium]|nr:energy-coupled thiamine transporter ThiT [Clostridia bacterium]
MEKTKRLTVSAMMIAISTVLAVICGLIPFLNLPFGGGFTIASMLPIVIISYMYGIKWGLFSSAVYAVIQILMDLMLGVGGSTIMALFLPNSEDFMGYAAAV